MAIGNARKTPLGMPLANSKKTLPHPSLTSGRDGPRRGGASESEQADPRRRRDRHKLTQGLVLQPALEEGRVLLLEEERQPRAARLHDAVFQRGEPRL